MGNTQYPDMMNDLLECISETARLLDRYGLAEYLPFADPKEGAISSFRKDLLVCLLRVMDPEREITTEIVDYMTKHVGFGEAFSAGYLRAMSEKVHSDAVPSISTLLASFIIIDHQVGDNKLCKIYIQALSYMTFGLFRCEDSVTVREIIRYYHSLTWDIELAEKALGKQVGYEPLQHVERDLAEAVRKAAGLHEELFGCGKNANDTALEVSILKTVAYSTDREDDSLQSEPGTGEAPKPDENVASETSGEYHSGREELASLIGLREVKKQITSMVNALEIQKRCRELDVRRHQIAMHMVFVGNPGTGKTTAARIIGKIFREAGLLPKGHLVEVSRAELVGKYVGHTAALVKEAFEKARGGILFIDEAYSLTHEDAGGFGNEALETLLKLMEDHREDTAVIAAGYPALMQEFLYSNPGLASRFPFVIRFQDYSPAELKRIFLLMCRENDIRPERGVMAAVQRRFEAECAKGRKTSGNARFVRNFFEKMLMRQADRLMAAGQYEKEDLQRITLQDLPDENPLRIL